MTRVQGDLKIITGTAEAVTEVWVRSKVARPVPGGWLMTTNDRKPVFDGKVDVELLPGACVLVAVFSGLPGETVELIVPESGTASLEACIRAAEAAGDLERDALDELRRDFGAWLDEARASLATADGSAKAAKAEADKAKGSADAAGKSATAAAKSASDAKAGADRVGTAEQVGKWASEARASASAADGSAKAADKSRSDASSFANSAKSASESASAAAQSATDSASAAKSSADAAKASAGESATSASVAREHRLAAQSAAESATGSADAAKGSADAAGKSASAATSSASAAKAGAERAANIASSTSWDGDKLTVNGKTSPSLTGPRGYKGEKGEPGVARGVAVHGDGSSPEAKGNESVAVGWNSKAEGHYSVAAGNATSAAGTRSVVVGTSSAAEGEYSAVVGYLSEATADATTAIGHGHEVTTPGETHIGVADRIADWMGVSQHVVLHGTAEATKPATEPGHLVSKGYVDEKLESLGSGGAKSGFDQSHFFFEAKNPDDDKWRTFPTFFDGKNLYALVHEDLMVGIDMETGVGRDRRYRVRVEDPDNEFVISSFTLMGEAVLAAETAEALKAAMAELEGDGYEPQSSIVFGIKTETAYMVANWTSDEGGGFFLDLPKKYSGLNGVITLGFM